MPDFDIALNMRRLDGSLILALEDEANGYWVRSGGMPAEDRTPNRTEIRHPKVDGFAELPATLDGAMVSVLVKVFGSSWAQVSQRVEALKNAAPLSPWLLEQVIEGVSTTRRAGSVEVLIPEVTPMDIANKRRFVSLSFRVQPSSVVEYL